MSKEAEEGPASEGERRDLGCEADISRRDFLNGVAVSVGALGSLPAAHWLRAGLAQGGGGPYPPALTGLRGSHDGAFEVAHRLRDGARPQTFGRAVDTTERYDLIVVGAGISGLAAAHFFRERAGAQARILVLDNHDDFGGHARRNEFTVDGRLLVGYGGTQSIDGPAGYSAESKGLLKALAIDTQAFYTHFDRQYFSRLKLSTGVFFDRETYGKDVLVPRPRGHGDAAFLARTPLSAKARRDLARLSTERKDYLAGKTPDEKLQILAKTSYRDWLLHHVHVGPEVVAYFQNRTHDLYGLGIDAVPAGDCRGLGYEGFSGLGLGEREGPGQGLSASGSDDEPYIFHFPDGNASIARLLVRRLIPGVLDGHSMTDIVTARARYERLDLPANAVRLRLRSTAVLVRHEKANASGDVEVTYIRDGRAHRVRGARCVLACWHGIIPHICPEIPTAQQDALRYQVKVPLVYTNVALRRWTALANQGVYAVRAPSMYWSSATVDFPVSMGAYRFAKGPEEPVLLHVLRTPNKPGAPSRDQHRLGRTELLTTTFAAFETQLRSQLTRMLAPAGFDPARDIAGITVNRWSHGYSYEYNSLFDPAWPAGQAPHELARVRRGSIAIANADAAAYAYTDAAIDQAYRAVRELT
jgi:spermidine dehydrogenase